MKRTLSGLCDCGGAIHAASEMHYRTCEHVLARSDLSALGIYVLRTLQEKGVPTVPIVILDCPAHAPHWHGPKGMEAVLKATGRWWGRTAAIPDQEVDLLADIFGTRDDDLAGALGMLPAMNQNLDTLTLNDLCEFWRKTVGEHLTAFGAHDLRRALHTAWTVHMQERDEQTKGFRRK